MPHIHTDPGQFDQTASAFVFRTDFDEPKLMLHMHRRLNKYLQFGGHIELNEHPWQTVEHELREESGYTLNQLKLLQPDLPIIKHQNYRGSAAHPLPFAYGSYQFALTDHLHTDIAFAFITGEEPKYKPEEDESSEIAIFSRTEIEALKAPEQIPTNVKTLILFAFNNILNHWKAVDPLEFQVSPIKIND